MQPQTSAQPAAGAVPAGTAPAPHAPPPPMPPLLALDAEVAGTLDELCSSLDEARELQRAAVDPADKEEAGLMVEEVEREMNSIMLQVAEQLCGITGIGRVNIFVAGAPAASSSSAPAAAAAAAPPPSRHQVRWEDGRTYACQIVSLKYDTSSADKKKSIVGIIDIVGFPGNSEKGKQEHANLGHLSQWRGWGGPTLDVGTKCFAVGDEGIFVPAVIDRSFGGNVLVKLSPLQQQQNDDDERVPEKQQQQPAATAATVTGPVRQLPLTHLRPYTAAPPHGRTLRRRWENMSAAERAEVEAERKAKKAAQEEKKRRQRTEQIGSAASEWSEMKAMFSGGKKKF